MSYAANTTVDSGKTRAEIESLLLRRGATGFVAGWDAVENANFLQFKFEIAGATRIVQMSVPMPDPNGDEFLRTPTGLRRGLTAARSLYEKSCRQRWRQTKLVIVAKMEAVEVGISTFEREFLPDLLLPNGRTVGTELIPQLPEITSGRTPLLLPGASE